MGVGGCVLGVCGGCGGVWGCVWGVCVGGVCVFQKAQNFV